MASATTLVWTFLIIAFFLYIFAILGLELVRPDPTASKEYNIIIETNFKSLWGTLLTLLQGLTLDSMGTVYRPIVEAKPHLFFYFILFILVVSIALMNLITAIMVEASMHQAAQDQAVVAAHQADEKKKMIQSLEALFRDLDTDGSGMLDFEELENGPPDVKERLGMIIDLADLRRIFDTLDYDRSGQLEIAEFCEGLLKVQEGKPLELTTIIRQCHDILVELSNYINRDVGTPKRKASKCSSGGMASKCSSGPLKCDFFDV